MRSERLTRIERRLLRMRAELAHDQVLLHRDSLVDEDEVDSRGDLASWMPSERVLSGLLDRAARVRTEVDAALERLRAGTFGQCVRCDGAIATERLEAIPYVDTCIGCARTTR